MIACPHFTRARDKGQGTCALGLYGGKPWPADCLGCIRRSENNPDFAEHLRKRYAQNHPEKYRGLTGC